jgi:hypothetical protein
MLGISKQRIMRGKFRNLRIVALDEIQIVTCELGIELRSSYKDPQRFFLYWQFSGRQIYNRAYTLAKAQHLARTMFEEQLEPWEWIEPASAGGDNLRE